MSEVNLKRCPFCGGEAELRKHNRGCVFAYGVRCKNLCVEQYTLENKETAIKDWNTRRPTDSAIEKLEHLVEVCDEQIVEYNRRGIEESVQDYSTELEAYKQSIKIIKGCVEC